MISFTCLQLLQTLNSNQQHILLMIIIIIIGMTSSQQQLHYRKKIVYISRYQSNVFFMNSCKLFSSCSVTKWNEIHHLKLILISLYLVNADKTVIFNHTGLLHKIFIITGQCRAYLLKDIRNYYHSVRNSNIIMLSLNSVVVYALAM